MVKHSHEKKYSCDECQKTFATQSQVTMHKTSMHSDVRPYVCDCGKAFKLKGALDKHRKYTHTKELVRPTYFCDECGKSEWNFNNFRDFVVIFFPFQ